MPRASEHFDRDREADAKAREWAEKARQDAEDGKLADDAEYLRHKLDEEKRKLQRR